MSSTLAQACCDGAYGLVLCYLGPCRSGTQKALSAKLTRLRVSTERSCHFQMQPICERSCEVRILTPREHGLWP
jgi:hypothetical protein